ncbi:MAG: hypothetical protein M1130_12480 [Actinobacteria bacterium]|nr:hypothetical protein [Actinomycetota bacterium]
MEKDNRYIKSQKLCAYSGVATMALGVALLVFFEIMHHFLRASRIGTYEIIVSYISILFFVGTGWMVFTAAYLLENISVERKESSDESTAVKIAEQKLESM